MQGSKRGNERMRGFGAIGNRRERKRSRPSKTGNALWLPTGPRSIDVVDFAMARVAELKELQKAALEKGGNRRVFQRLSWHQRRRTMSHTSHRMPRRLREAHRRELSADGKDVEKRTGVRGKMRCRKYRRRANWLMALRRLRTLKKGEAGIWLETHIWHAKRFQMGEIWGGRKVALWPVDRGLRSGWKAASCSCVGHDASYLDVIELITDGRRESLQHILGSCVEGGHDGTEMTIDVLLGRRMVDTVIYDKLFKRTAGPASIMWRPNGKQVWLWVHPGARQDILSVLESVNQEKLVEIRALPNRICRFELIGPRAMDAVTSVLAKTKSHNEEWQELRYLRSAASLSEKRIVSLEVEDPRASFPPKQKESSKRKPSPHLLRKLLTNELWTEDSRLWDAQQREQLAESAKHTDGTPYLFVPVLCVQRPGSLAGGFGSGWTVILPGSWGMAFWVSFMYATGARAVGLREMRHLATESLQPFFPHDFPDAEAALRASEIEEMRLRYLHERRPKSKRINYYKYRIASPFKPDFENLFRESRYGDRSGGYTRELALSRMAPLHISSRDTPDLHTSALYTRAPHVSPLEVYDDDVERPPQKRRELTLPSFGVIRGWDQVLPAIGLNTIPNKGPRTDSGGGIERRTRWVPKAKAKKEGAISLHGVALSSSANYLNTFTRHFMATGRALIRVSLRPVKKGYPIDNAIVCFPSDSDFEAFEGGELHAEEFREPLRDSKSRNHSPTRQVIGYVTAGTYSLRRGKGIGTAFITLNGARMIIQRNDNKRKGIQRRRNAENLTREGLVLFRNTCSLQYRFAIATILTESMVHKFADPEVDPALTASASLKTARDAMHDLVISLELDQPNPSAIHTLGPISPSSTRISFLKALRSVRDAHSAGGGYGNDTERVTRLRQDASIAIKRTNDAIECLEKVVELGRTGDIFAGVNEKRRGVLKVAAQRSGAQCVEGLAGDAGSVTVCGNTFLADFRFEGENVRVDFRHLLSPNNAGGSGLAELRHGDVDRDFEKLVKDQALDDLCLAFKSLLGIEKLAGALGARPQVLKMPMQCFEEDVITAFGLVSAVSVVKRTARGLTIDYHSRYFPAKSSETWSNGRQIRTTDKYLARLDLEPTARKQKFLIGSTRPQLGPEEEEGISDIGLLSTNRNMVKKVVYSSARAADIAATFVLVLDGPVLVSHTTAVALNALSGALPLADTNAQVVLSAKTSASMTSPPPLAQAAANSKSRNLSSLLSPDKVATENGVLSTQCQTPYGPVKFSIGVAEEEAGMKVSRVPITHPRDVERVVGLLKQQLVYNEILQSCLSGGVIDDKQSSTPSQDSVLPNSVEAVVRYAPSFIQFSVSSGDELLTVGVVVKVGGDISVSTKLIDAQGEQDNTGSKLMACSDTMATEMFTRTRSAPMVLAKMWAMNRG